MSLRKVIGICVNCEEEMLVSTNPGYNEGWCQKCLHTRGARARHKAVPYVGPRDKGCRLHNHCLTCPEPRCIEDFAKV